VVIRYFPIAFDRELIVGVPVRVGHQQILADRGGIAKILLGPEADRSRSGFGKAGRGNDVARKRSPALWVPEGETRDARKIAVTPRLDGHGAEQLHSPALAVGLVISEEKRTIVDDGPANRASELVAIQAAGFGQESIARVKHIVTPE